MNSSMFEGGMTLFSDFRGTVGAILRLTQLMIVSSIPFIILFILFRIIDRHKFKIQKEVMIFSVLLFCTSAITFGIYFNVVDAEQYFSKSFIPLLFILYALVLLYTFCSGSVLIKSLSVGMMVFALFYSRPFVYNYHNRAGLIVNKEVTEKFFQKLNTKDIQLRMAFINSDCFFKFSYRYNSRAYMPYKYFNYFVDPLVNTSLDYPSATDSITCDKDHGNPYTEENIRDKPFVRFVEHQRQEGDFKTLDDSRIRFIKKFRINTLVWDKNAKLYSGLSNMIDSSTILLDTLPNHHQTEYYIAELKSEF
ncbi:MAG TPA: hypothetical protein PLU27_13690 [Ginsengibacter sp.]|nr:hypothetical protein [Ginsengibacter sp.]